MKTKEEIIQSVCLTLNHAYMFPAFSGNQTRAWYDCSLTQSEKDFLYSQMKQLFENDIEPYMEFKN